MNDYIEEARAMGDERNALDILAEAPMKDTGPRVFIIPSPNMSKFEERFAKLVKRALKIGCQVPTYTTLKEEPKTIQVLVDEIEDDFGNVKPVYETRTILLHHLTIECGSVVVAGHEFVCSIEHTEEGNILHTLKGKSVPLQYRECKPWCDHCKTLRRRNDTFVVRHIDTDTYLQVGRNCLADFLGRDAERYAAMAELYYEVDELGQACEEEGEGGWGSGGPSYDLLDQYLGYVAEVITHCGWKSRSSAKEYGGAATADIASRHLHPQRGDRVGKELMFRTPSEKSLETAKAAITWCQEIGDMEVEASEYLHNIRVIARRGLVGGRQSGYAASIVSGYQRHIGELKRKERYAAQGAISQYVGTVDEHIKIQVLVDHVVNLPDYGWGTSALNLLVDKEGNRLTWKSRDALEKGTEVWLKGTVKAHEEYRGRNGNDPPIKQTKLSRCSVLTMKTYIVVWNDKVASEIFEVTAEDEKAARKAALEVTKATRLPRGTTFQEKPVEPVVPVVSDRDSSPSQEV